MYPWSWSGIYCFAPMVVTTLKREFHRFLCYGFYLPDRPRYHVLTDSSSTYFEEPMSYLWDCNIAILKDRLRYTCSLIVRSGYNVHLGCKVVIRYASWQIGCDTMRETQLTHPLTPHKLCRWSESVTECRWTPQSEILNKHHASL